MVSLAFTGLNVEDVLIFQAIEKMAERKVTLEEKRKVWGREIQMRAIGHGLDPIELYRKSRIWLQIRPMMGLHGVNLN